MDNAAAAPRLTETVSALGETIRQVWMCEPPAPGISYTVVRQHWDNDYTERVIDEIRIT